MLLLLLLLLCGPAAFAQRTVTGTITDDSGMGLIGATVLLQDTDRGTATDVDGNYSIEVEGDDAVLLISYLGYATTEEAVGNRSVVDVTLQPNGQLLSEVVVVGYGTQRREAVTGSVASINGEELTNVSATNVTQSLQGRLPGVDISSTSSRPGASAQIRIRGTRSLTASNDPLIVLDGIPFAGSLTDINPNDIKSVDVLKDASATAIYGSRGANGVILITTRTGFEGQRARLSYNSFAGVNTLFSKIPLMSGDDFAQLRADAGLYTNGQDEVAGTNTDWQDLFYRDGLFMNHSLGLAGGTDKGSYSFSAGYNTDQAVIPDQGFRRYTLRGSLDQRVGSVLRVGFTTNNTYTHSYGNDLSPGNILFQSPLASPYDSTGAPRRTIRTALDEPFVVTRDVIDRLGDRRVSENRGMGSYNTLFGELTIPGVDGLSYRLNLGLNVRNNTNGNFTGEGVFATNPTTLSGAGIGNSLLTSYVLENLLNYERSFAGVHNLSVLGLYSVQEDRYNSSAVSARDIPNEAFQYYNLGQAAGEITVNPGSQNYSVTGLISYMGRIMYDYDNRYLFSATLRTDGSSRLADGNKWHTYPALSAGWNISQEPFMQDLSWLNRLKLRVGWGQTSNQAISPYSTLGSLATRPYNFGSEFATGYYVSTLPNPNLGWEYSVTTNVGADFALLNNRLSGTLEYYVTNTEDILLGVSLPSTSGVGSYTANIGTTQNKGVEFSLNGLIVDNPQGLSWEAGFNVYRNVNTLTSLASGQERDEGNSWFVGYPINVIYDYNRIGLWQEGDPYLDILEPGGNVGQIKVEYTGEYGENGEPVRAIGPDDRQILDISPDFQGGFNTRFTFRGLDLTAVGVFQSGGTLISTLYGSASYLNLLSGRQSNIDVDYYTPENTGARYPAPSGVRSGDNPEYGSTLSYFDGGYLKFRTITLGYDLTRNVFTSDAFSQFRIYTSVQNPFVLFSPYNDMTGMDPETNARGNEYSAVAGYNSRLLTIGYNNPATRVFLLGLNVTF
ncbi:SusC/RagA family TonB-linked outer membrane protein [Lewinella sp. IMCC34183]|uniref:SusC/RagA family TonB-linked outer membrane protein n=1 Tax=Lewinella sp. IMCC34183 TaxID=2248762 RepID=UPI0018E50587|nr:TonB-dependent receptor [Lewinella sp. IMCC34183]